MENPIGRMKTDLYDNNVYVYTCMCLNDILGEQDGVREGEIGAPEGFRRVRVYRVFYLFLCTS